MKNCTTSGLKFNGKDTNLICPAPWYNPNKRGPGKCSQFGQCTTSGLKFNGKDANLICPAPWYNPNKTGPGKCSQFGDYPKPMCPPGYKYPKSTKFGTVDENIHTKLFNMAMANYKIFITLAKQAKKDGNIALGAMYLKRANDNLQIAEYHLLLIRYEEPEI
jgi:hypothetical protein